MIRDLINSIKKFNRAGDNIEPVRPTLPSKRIRVLRKNLLREEFEEYLDAEENNDLIELADALGDIIYVAVGTALEYGIPIDLVLEEICRSNLTKVVDGKLIKRDDGKILKPDTYSPPDLVRVMFYNSAGRVMNAT